MSNLKQLSSLLVRRNAIDEKITALIGRPAIRGHVGEWIAQEIFKVKAGKIRESEGLRRPVYRRSAGRTDGECEVVRQARGAARHQSSQRPGQYLVLTGPKAEATTSKGQTRPLVITEVFLFDASALVEQFKVQKRRLGVAASVRQHEWKTARVYPKAAPGARLTLTDAQREALKLFR